MSRLAWAKFPTQWLKPSTIPGPPGPVGEERPSYPLAELQWSRYSGSAIAAVLVLVSLAIRLNQSHKGQAFGAGVVRGSSVGVTFEELRRMTGLAKVSISSALMLLEGFGAIQSERVGRSNQYRLIGLEVDGGWCELPQGWLLNRDGTLKLKQLPRNRRTLNAMKAYLLLMVLRDRRHNTAAVSFTAITKWTGIRREDIPNALGTLSALHLAKVSFDRDIRHRKGDNSHRYSIVGLGNGQALYHDEDMTTMEVVGNEFVFSSPVETSVTKLARAAPALPPDSTAKPQLPPVFVAPNPGILSVPPPWNASKP